MVVSLSHELTFHPLPEDIGCRLDSMRLSGIGFKIKT